MEIVSSVVRASLTSHRWFNPTLGKFTIWMSNDIFFYMPVGYRHCSITYHADELVKYKSRVWRNRELL